MRFGQLRKYLDPKSTVTDRLVQAFVTSRLEHCNNLQYGHLWDQSKLRLQNFAVGLVTVPLQQRWAYYSLHPTSVALATSTLSYYKTAVLAFKLLSGWPRSILQILLLNTHQVAVCDRRDNFFFPILQFPRLRFMGQIFYRGCPGGLEQSAG